MNKLDLLAAVSGSAHSLIAERLLCHYLLNASSVLVLNVLRSNELIFETRLRSEIAAISIEHNVIASLPRKQTRIERTIRTKTI